jgi:hypothetical protein
LAYSSSRYWVSGSSGSGCEGSGGTYAMACERGRLMFPLFSLERNTFFSNLVQTVNEGLKIPYSERDKICQYSVPYGCSPSIFRVIPVVLSSLAPRAARRRVDVSH